MNPTVSITMITRDRAGFIARAIESVLKQSFSDWELIIIDDDSKDDTEGVIRSFMSKDKRIRYQKNFPTLGISKSRNLGISMSKGKYVAVLDSDDVWTDNMKLKKQLDFLENNPDYVLIGSNVRIVDDKDGFIKNTEFKLEDIDIRSKMLKFNQIAHSTVMYRKESAEKIGGYDERLSCVEDLDIFLRLGLTGKMKNLEDMTTSYTKHRGGTSYAKRLSMAWNNLLIVWRNFGKYPNWFMAIFIAKLRVIKNLL